MSSKDGAMYQRKLVCEELESRYLLSPAPPSWHLSLGSNTTAGDLPIKQADIGLFDGISFDRIFYGSAYGIGEFVIDALAALSDGFVMSFLAPCRVPGITGRVESCDLVKYTVDTSIFSMYLDGSDVGLALDRENIDAVEILPDGRIVISTTGSFIVPGVSGNSRDLVAFTPDRLGPTTSGTWTVYLRGRDIGLDRLSENIDALAIDGDILYVSTSGYFRSGRVVAFEEDVVALKDGAASVVLRGADLGWEDYSIKALDLPFSQPLPVPQLHPKELVNELFVQAFGRQPGLVNTSYWQSRTDVTGSDLLAAMEQAEAEYQAAMPTMSLYAFDAHGQAVLSPTGVAEDDRLQVRFANAQASEEVGIHLVFDGTVVKSSTAIANSDGEAVVDIYVPNPLLPEDFSGSVSGTIDVLMICGDRAELRTLQLREGPRLLLKSAEVKEGEHMHFAVRGVTADEEVKVTVRYDWGTGSREQTWTIGRTDGSNRLDPANAKLLAPTWIRGSADRDGIEVNITVGKDHRGYQATLIKGEPRADIIAELIRTNGTSSIEAELAVLLSEEERILADGLLGDDWEGNAAAIDQALDAFLVQGGGFGGDLRDFLDQMVPGATQKAVISLLPRVRESSPLPLQQTYEVLQCLAQNFSKAHEARYQDEVEEKRGGGIRLENMPTDRFTQDYEWNSRRHVGTDFDASPGTMIRSSVKGTVAYLDSPASESYGTMAVTIKVDLDQAVSLPLRHSGESITTSVVYLTYGHLRPSRAQQVSTNPATRFADGILAESSLANPDFTLKVGQPVQVGQTLGFLEGFGPSEIPDGTMRTYYFGFGTSPHLHVTMSVSANAGDYLAGVALPSKFGLYLDVLAALPLIKKHMK